MNNVFVYRNLNRKGVVWSVKDTKTGLVIDRATTVVLSNVQLKVSQAGRIRVLKQKRKNVHAGVCGKRIKRAPSNLKWKRASYNPYKMSTFQKINGQFIFNAKYAKLTKYGLFVYD